MQTQRPKVYLALVGCAVGALLLDRLVLTESATLPSVAVGDPGSDQGGGVGNSPGVEKLLASIPEIPFPRNLPPLSAFSSIPDLFADPSTRLRGESYGEAAENGLQRGGTGGLPERASTNQFQRRYQLDGVMVYQRLKIAIIDGRPVRPGDTIDGCTLSDVSGLEARFECHDGVVALKIANSDTRAPD